jgi:hypothetical protein
VRALVKRIAEGEGAPAASEVIAPTLVIRESSQPPIPYPAGERAEGAARN